MVAKLRKETLSVKPNRALKIIAYNILTIFVILYLNNPFKVRLFINLIRTVSGTLDQHYASVVSKLTGLKASQQTNEKF